MCWTHSMHTHSRNCGGTPMNKKKKTNTKNHIQIQPNQPNQTIQVSTYAIVGRDMKGMVWWKICNCIEYALVYGHRRANTHTHTHSTSERIAYRMRMVFCIELR